MTKELEQHKNEREALESQLGLTKNEIVHY